MDNSYPRSPLAVVLSHIGPIAAAAEILRRMVWGFLRLEHEQLQVVGAPAQKELELQSMEPMALGAGEQGSGVVPAELVALLDKRLALDVKTPLAKVSLSLSLSLTRSCDDCISYSIASFNRLGLWRRRHSAALSFYSLRC